MTVNSTHPAYGQWIKNVYKCRTAIRGQQAIKEGGTTFLPRGSAMNDNDYREYIERALFIGASGRTVDALVGSIFRKKPELGGIDNIEDYLSNIDLQGKTFTQFASEITRDVIGVGRAGILVDYSDIEQRPYVSFYSAESIVNWWTEFVNGLLVVTMVVLKEQTTQRNGFFDISNSTRYRVLRLDDDGNYINEIYTETKNNNFDITDYVMPTIKGKPLKFIPFVCVNPSKIGFECENPIVNSIVDLNIGHYRNYADLEMGRHYTGLPTPVITGITNADKIASYAIGSKSAWILPEKATAQFLEFKGDGLGNLSTGLKEKEDQMSMLGASLISQSSSRGDSSATEWNIRNAGETSVLTMVSNTVSYGLELVLFYMSLYSGFEVDRNEIKVRLNTDFVAARLGSDELRAMTEAVQSGVMSPETYIHNLSVGELLPEGTDIKKEASDLSSRINKLTETSTQSNGV